MLEDAEKGTLPRERLYGLDILLGSDLEVVVDDRRFESVSRKVADWLRERLGLRLPDLYTLKSALEADVVVVKDLLITPLTVLCYLMDTEIIYLDALLRFPKSRLRQVLDKFNIRLASTVIAYSHSQVGYWCEQLRLDRDNFTVLPFPLDYTFYRPYQCHGTDHDDYVVAAGRDLGRDFGTLCRAALRLGLDVKLVTLPYLLDDVPVENPKIEIYEDIPYQELFDLYNYASAIAIPLEKGMMYPTGVRALLEGMFLGRPVIVSRTPVLEEYAQDTEHVLFVEPEDVDSMEFALRTLMTEEQRLSQMAQRASQHVMTKFSLDQFNKPFLETVAAMVNR